MSDFGTKVGDTLPWDFELISDHAPTWTLEGSVTITISRKGQTTNVVTKSPCEIIDGALHYVRWRPTAQQMTLANGHYNFEFEWIDNDGIIASFPSGKDDEPDFAEADISPQLA